VVLALSGILYSGNAIAEVFRSSPWQMGFQTPGSESAIRIFAFHDMLLVIEVAIVLLVMVLMVYIIIKFNAKANPVPSKTTHNTMLEVVWTAVPILILIVIAIPSLKLLYFIDKTEKPEMTLKVTGNQWYWSYTYPDLDDLEFDSILLEDDELEEGQPRLLSVDNPVVLPVNTNVRILLVSNDVIHNFAVPSLGLKLDNTPGRTNETWTNINKPGTYYGMCSELCGVNHGFMPIQVVALSKEDYAVWTEQAKLEFADNSEPGTLLSSGTVKVAAIVSQ
jgi:cytochrome c oxidase subunit 2